MRRLKKTKAIVTQVGVETLPQQIIVSGEISDEVMIIEDNNIVRTIDSSFCFNHTFPAPTSKPGLAASGEIDIEHITTTLLKGGKQIAKDYLLAISVIIEGQPRKIVERFLLHQIADLPYPITETKVIYKPKTILNKEEKEEDWETIIASLEKELEDKLTRTIEEQFTQRIEEEFTERIDQQFEQKIAKIKNEILAAEKQKQILELERKKEKIIMASKRQWAKGNQARFKINKGG